MGGISLSFAPLAGLTEAAACIDEILRRRRDRWVKNAAQMIYEAGVSVLEMRAVGDRLNLLLQPLMLFNPVDSPSDQDS